MGISKNVPRGTSAIPDGWDSSCSRMRSGGIWLMAAARLNPAVGIDGGNVGLTKKMFHVEHFFVVASSSERSSRIAAIVPLCRKCSTWNIVCDPTSRRMVAAAFDPERHRAARMFRSSAHLRRRIAPHF